MKGRKLERTPVKINGVDGDSERDRDSEKEDVEADDRKRAAGERQEDEADSSGDESNIAEKGNGNSLRVSVNVMEWMMNEWTDD